jgi:hypothetical protein
VERENGNIALRMDVMFRYGGDGSSGGQERTQIIYTQHVVYVVVVRHGEVLCTAPARNILLPYFVYKAKFVGDFGVDGSRICEVSRGGFSVLCPSFRARGTSRGTFCKFQ